MSSSLTTPSLHSHLQQARHLLNLLQGSDEEKESLLNQIPQVEQIESHFPLIKELLANLPVEQRVAFKSFAALNPPQILFDSQNRTHWHQFFQFLSEIDQFYKPMGGLIGYYITVLDLFSAQQQNKSLDPSSNLLHIPPCIDLTKEFALARESVRWGIEALPSIALLAPIGGAGDRLDLHDPITNEPLPAAALPFLGRSLLEELIRDVQAWELLYENLTGRSIQIPLALMTSTEKENDRRMKALCEEHDWFGRSPDLFFFFTQPQVPLIDEEGQWVVNGPLSLFCKPGGHGVIWHLAEDRGVFDWLDSLQKSHLLIRQINNPMASIDQTLLALMGYGVHEQKSFGFAACPTFPKAAEGVDLLLEQRFPNSRAFCITNVEYTDFAKWGVNPHINSQFPANTNLLFASIKAIREGIKKIPLPAPLVNFKTKVDVPTPSGEIRSLRAGRLESTMQNIAEAFQDSFPLDHPLPTREELQTFLIYNERIKTISVTKRQWRPGEPAIETPEGAFYDLLVNNSRLLNLCHVGIPKLVSVEEYLAKGPNFTFLYHPALGPIYNIIQQKIKGGTLYEHAELVAEIANLTCLNLSLKGSLHILDQALLCHRKPLPKCLLKNVRIENRGIDRSSPHRYWKNEVLREECTQIVLHENSCFIAEDVTIVGSHTFEAFPGECLSLSMSPNGDLISKRASIKQGKRGVSCQFNSDHQIQLN